jgi:hypothetical protein
MNIIEQIKFTDIGQFFLYLLQWVEWLIVTITLNINLAMHSYRELQYC